MPKFILVDFELRKLQTLLGSRRRHARRNMAGNVLRWWVLDVTEGSI